MVEKICAVMVLLVMVGGVTALAGLVSLLIRRTDIGIGLIALALLLGLVSWIVRTAIC